MAARQISSGVAPAAGFPVGEPFLQRERPEILAVERQDIEGHETDIARLFAGDGKDDRALPCGNDVVVVVVKDNNGETVYRYGDASREAAKRDTRGFMLFTCGLPRPFVVQDAKAMASLKTARIVKAGDPAFAELDRQSPLVRSAIPKQRKTAGRL